MIRILLYILICISVLSSCTPKKLKEANTPINDSIQKYLDLGGDESLGLRERDFYNELAFRFINFSINSKLRRNQLFCLSDNYYEYNCEKFKLINEKLLKLSKFNNDSINIGRSYRNLGLYYMDKSKNKEAIKFLYKAEHIFLKLKKTDYISNIYLDKAFVFFYENDYVSCESAASKALIILNHRENNYRKKYDAYNLIAVSSNELKNYQRAIKYHKKALLLAKYFLSENSTNLQANSKNNIGVVYQNLNNHNEAIKYFKNALNEKNISNNQLELYAMLIDNLAYSKLKIGDKNDLPDLFFKALKIRTEKKMLSGIIASKHHISEYYTNIGDSIRSKKIAIEALNLSKAIKTSGDILVSLNLLSIIDKSHELSYLREYIKISDSLQVAERNF